MRITKASSGWTINNVQLTIKEPTYCIPFPTYNCPLSIVTCLLLILTSAKAFSASSIPAAFFSPPLPLTTPVASFNISDSMICTGSCINFTDASLNSPTSWSWTFNGATPSSSSTQSPSNVCYNSPGTYAATLVVSNASGSDTAIKNVIVTGPPNQSVLRFQRAIGTAGNDQVRDIRQTNDDGFIIAGFIDTTGATNPSLVKTGATGNVQWVKTYGGSGNNEVFNSVRQTSDNGYIANGYTDSFGAGGTDAYVVKTDATGNVLWSHTFGGSGSDDSYSGQQTADGGYIIAGSYFGTDADLFLVKMDASGNLLWTKTIGGTGNEFAYSVQQTNDKGYITTGSTTSFGAAGNDVYLVKTDSVGTVQWTKTYGGSGDEQGNSVQQTKDGGYIIMGKSNSFLPNQIYIIKTDPAGDTLWTKTYKGTYGYGIEQTTDGGYAIAGMFNVTPINGDMYLLKIDSAGNLQWAKAYGGGNPDIGYCGRQTADGGYIVSGITTSFGAGNNDIYLVKTDSLGNSGCHEASVTPAHSGGGFISTGGSSANLGGQTNVATIVNTPILQNSLQCMDSVSMQTAYSFCAGGSVTLHAFGGSSYSWSPSTGLSNSTIDDPVASPSVNTTYTLTVYRGPCSITKNVTVAVLPLPVISISGDSVMCSGGFATLSASGGVTYSWSNGATTSSIIVSPSITTTYSVTGTDSSGCSGSNAATVTVTTAITAAIIGDTVICQGQTDTLIASGGSSYSWSTGATTQTILINPSVLTTYTVIAVSGSCADTATATVTVNPAVTASISNDTTICAGQNVILTASGGTNYSWSTGASTFSIGVNPTLSTTYSVMVSNGNCFDTASVNVTVISSATIGITNDTSVCQSQSVTLTVSGGTSYVWSTGATTTSLIVTPANTTTYSVVVSNGTCANSATVQVAVAFPFTAVISNDTTLCQGPTIVLTVSGGNQYLWSNGDTTSSISVAPSTTTTYSVLASNGGCFDTASVNVTVNPTPVVSISKDTTICRYQTMTFTASGGTSYLWSTGSTKSSIIVQPSSTTIYSVTVSNGTCSATGNVTATVNNVVGATITGTTTLCDGHSTTLSATGGIYFYWITGDTTQSISVAPSITTPYWVWVSNGTCIDTARVTITVIPAPTVTAGTDTMILIGTTVTLSGTGGPNYNWTPATGLSCTACPNPSASPTATTTYVLTVTYGNGCSNSDSVTVSVDVKCGEVFVPNAFSPNHDGENDVLTVKNNCIKSMSFIIYDRWGEKVFESEDVKKGWDGTYNGKSLNSAVFVYYLNALLYTGQLVTQKGSIHLIK